ncbi:hypothetical protein GCM10011371_21290 [Novosphingobium marinum]|uniref:EthD domain-containing protein n=1 Tax=Novosphingobium marinum TaxID=1514948 RepID=A0A7Y9XX88_9SPHN|nr:EthD domain-containing protein [Novosphingobium marinum]NYH96242.1 hypothetical protein [Novosphingobium marinum]GGC33616.1 hypothetical protein GCM10011371_21290 [Novosphingobium marinum]
MGERVGLAKAALYFDATNGIDAAIDAAQAQADELAGTLPGGIAQRLARRVTDMPLIPHQKVMADSPKPFDIAYQLSSENDADRDAMVLAVAAMAETIAAHIDKGHAAVLVGREIAITRGDGPIYNIMPLRALPGMTHDEFMHHWFDRHATLGEGVDGVRYRQNHVDYPPTEDLAARIGLSFEPMDGLTESYFDSVDAAVEILSQETVAVDAIEDERRFIHHPRSQFGIYETVWRA